MRWLFMAQVFFLGATTLLAAEEPLIVRLQSASQNDRKAAVSELARERDETVKGLMEIVEKKVQAEKVRGAMHYAVGLLGKLRAVESIPLLIDNISYAPPAVGPEDMQCWFPCGLALVNMGSPAIQGIVKRLGRDATEEEIRLFAVVVRGIDGDQLGVARLELLLKKESSGPRKVNLAKLIEKLKRLGPARSK